MRNPSEPSHIVKFPLRASSRALTFPRRPILPSYRGVTCLVLVRHGQTDKAIKVSDTGESARAVWIPKAMVTIEQPSERGILVATMSKTFAEQKNLHPRFIDPALFNQATAEVLSDAVTRAARKRNFYRGHRDPLPYPGRNAFA
jgi:hypothetical protein